MTTPDAEAIGTPGAAGLAGFVRPRAMLSVASPARAATTKPMAARDDTLNDLRDDRLRGHVEAALCLVRRLRARPRLPSPRLAPRRGAQPADAGRVSMPSVERHHREDVRDR